jgi:hypothetical protein
MAQHITTIQEIRDRTVAQEQSGSHGLWPMHWCSVNLWRLQRYEHIEDNEREY